MEYLKMVIKGDAAKLINHIDPNPQNYRISYEILKNRYENKREILNSLIDRILKFPKIQRESADDLKSLNDSTSSTNALCRSKALVCRFRIGIRC